MNIVDECRYLYHIPHGGYPDGYYGSKTAVSMEDAKRNISRRARVVRVRLGIDGCALVDNGSQQYRKKLFERAIQERNK